ncbi:hypothetical protein ARZXY2_1304 [Arthrobacter sp. ZXY-2]|nr:hypothetical protein ARZXY2_1304 [Arthrobacter sp. ZXY-2]
MSTSEQHRHHRSHDHTLTGFLSAVTAVCQELNAADDADELERHVGWVSHSCEPDYQVLVELIGPAPGLALQLVIDLDIDSTVASAQIVGTADDESFTTDVEVGVRFLSHLVEHHLAPAARPCDGCTAPDSLRAPTWK